MEHCSIIAILDGLDSASTGGGNLEELDTQATVMPETWKNDYPKQEYRKGYKRDLKSRSS
ncbi:hypothetical protein M422DRAFT_267565 [Sphaerobolus stellatus SS14]|uniref:Uncharacterized protein n=1 Tax=Sphaerobolus stellatus (strain SS14) TaxID=990650 RepID=A0A0C9U8S6_SPHS4|nr:hypothetical protein M422DRAFT_267565 [Sphaerobolus stellatus SS14]